MTTKVVPIVSGGLDSTTMLYRLKQEGYDVPLALSFNYGQRHRTELDYAAATAQKLGIEHYVVDLTGITALLSAGGSSLVSDTPVPEGHYAEENMKQTVVPNRNAIMLNIAGGAAVAEGAQYIATAVHSGDHAIYPDCRPEFLRAMSEAIRLGNYGFGHFMGILAPYVHSTKGDIALDAFKLNVPIEETWSCYKGGDMHCGRCGTCVERLEAVDEAIERFAQMYEYRPVDGTLYEDSDYWKAVTK